MESSDNDTCDANRAAAAHFNVSHEGRLDEPHQDNQVQPNDAAGLSSRVDQVNSADRGQDENNPMQIQGDHKPFTTRQLLKALRKEETIKLREFLYALQGIEGDHFKYWENDGTNNHLGIYEGLHVRPDGLFKIQDPYLIGLSRLGGGCMDGFRIIGECGWLFKRVQKYVDRYRSTNINDTIAKGGVVSRALAVAFDKEIKNYLALVAGCEADLQRNALEFDLWSLLANMRGPKLNLKILAMLADGLRGFEGGRLLTGLHKHTIHGSPHHVALVQSLMDAASKPWFHMLYQWTMTGKLDDPHGEFFIVGKPNVLDKHLWHDRYQINKAEVPEGVMEKFLVKPSLIVGKGINFIRTCLRDTEWTLVLHEDKETASAECLSEEELKTRLGYHYVPPKLRRRAVSPLHRTLAHAVHQVNSHILTSLQEQHHLLEHLWALKQFFFLGQGDFITTLMDGLDQEFADKDGIDGIYVHFLMGRLDTALQSTNAAVLPSYTKERLGVELMVDDDTPEDSNSDENSEEGNADMRTGWDVFMLTYDVPDELAVIVRPKALSTYQLVFRLLFRLKHVEYMLNATWQQSTDLQHALFKYAQNKAIKLSTDARYARATVLLRKISLARQSMLHFVGNLQTYLMFDVLEGGWKYLATEIKQAQTLDDVIEAHDYYLDNIVRKSLLRGSIGLLSSKRDLRDKDLASQLEELLDLARTFCSIQERIFTDADLELQRAAKQQKEAQRRMEEEGHWGYQSESEEVQGFCGLTDESLIEKVVRVSEEFDEAIENVISGLEDKVKWSGWDDSPFSSREMSAPPSETASRRRGAAVDQEDMDSLRFLTLQLDYSNYYSEKRGEPSKGKKS